MKIDKMVLEDVTRASGEDYLEAGARIARQEVYVSAKMIVAALVAVTLLVIWVGVLCPKADDARLKAHPRTPHPAEHVTPNNL